ncbi:MAG TPA: M42 family metallopeptidase [Acholeplasma sp.]|nr:M42 family metallopeptidase [Acholeplasma sp.]
MKDLKLLKDLSELHGISGHERLVKEYLEKEYLKVVPKENIMYDGLGSIVAKKVGDPNGPKVLMVGHMDEIGLMVTRITKEGYIKFQTIGGWWSQVMLSQKFEILTSEGKKITAVMGSIPPHVLPRELLAKPFETKNMFLDIGVDSKEEAEKLGIKPGDPIAPVMEFEQLANKKYLLGKAWDNRVGCAMALKVFQNLKDEDHPNILYSGSTVQEEVGLRGARTIGNLVQPDISIATDTTIPSDLPENDNYVRIGNGPVLLIYDGATIGHKALRELIIKTAEEEKIPYQVDHLSSGGTDAGALHTSHYGSPAISFCIATRYIHSHSGVIHYDDYENGVKLLTAVIKKLDRKTVDELKYGK